MASAAEIEAERQRQAAQGRSDDGSGGVAGLTENVAKQTRQENKAERKSKQKISFAGNASSEKINSESNQSREKIAGQQIGSQERISANELASKAALQAGQITSNEKISGNEIGSREKIATEGNQSQERISTAGNESREKIAGLDRDAQLEQVREKIAADESQFARDFGLRQQTLGADILKTGAGLRGPLDYFQGDSYARGVQDAGLSPFVAALRGGTAPSIGGGTATTGNPTPLTVGTMADQLVGNSGVVSSGQSAATGRSNDSVVYAGGTPATTFSEQQGGVPIVGADVTSGGQANQAEGPSTGAGTAGSTTLPNLLNPGGAATDAYGRPLLSAAAQTQLNGISQTAQNGLANLPLGSLESLTPKELDAFKSGLDYLGRSSDDELTAYQRSRPGQQSALAA
jgi:hypothetical protein